MPGPLLVHQDTATNHLALFINVPVHEKSELSAYLDEQSTVWLDTSFVKAGIRGQWGSIPGRDYIFQISIDPTKLKELLTKNGATNIHPKWESVSIGSTKFPCCRLGFKLEYFKQVLQEVGYPEDENNVKNISSFWEQEKQLLEQETTSFPLNFDLGSELPPHVKQALEVDLSEEEKSLIKENTQKSRNNIKKNKKVKEEKVRLTPSNKIYDRILHDPTVDSSLFTIGYLDRFTGIIETDFHKFVTLDKELFYNSGVPFHRVQYFKYKGKEVWNRETRLNLIDGNGFLQIE